MIESISSTPGNAIWQKALCCIPFIGDIAAIILHRSQMAYLKSPVHRSLQERVAIFETLKQYHYITAVRALLHLAITVTILALGMIYIPFGIVAAIVFFLFACHAFYQAMRTPSSHALAACSAHSDTLVAARDV